MRPVGCITGARCTKNCQAPYTYPLVGGRIVSHLRGNVEALGLSLDEKDINDIESAYRFDPGFPHNFLNLSERATRGPEDVHLLRELGYFDHVKTPQAIQAHEGATDGP